MPQTTEDLAIVLRSQTLNERDKLVTLLTENHGRISGVAKGAVHSKRYGGSLDLFVSSHIRWTDKGTSDLVRIDEASLRKDFTQLRATLENISAAGYFADLLLRLTHERQPAREIFLLFAHYLVALDTHTVTPETVRSFELKLLDRLGYGPELENCAGCAQVLLGERATGVAVSLNRGGFLCKDCTPKGAPTIGGQTLLWLHQARHVGIRDTHALAFPLAALEQGAEILQDFLRYHCPGLQQYQFRSHALLERFLQEFKSQSTALERSSAT